jgi:hypothetical protein
MPNSLAHLRPRSDTLYVSQGYTVLATEQDGFVGNGAEHGLFVHETRLLSRYRWLIAGQPPQPVALSNTAQHTWLGYYIAPPPGDDKPETDSGSGQVPDAAQQTIEMRVSRYAGGGIHEDVDLTNFTQRAVAFTLELEAEADFADHPFPALYPRELATGLVVLDGLQPGASAAWPVPLCAAEHAAARPAPARVAAGDHDRQSAHRRWQDHDPLPAQGGRHERL